MTEDTRFEPIKKSNNKTLKCTMPKTMKKTINEPYIFAVKLYDIISIEQMVKSDFI